MLTIVQALKSNYIVTLTHGERYLLWNHIDKEYHVYERKGLMDDSRLVASDKDQKIAVDFLLGKR